MYIIQGFQNLTIYC